MKKELEHKLAELNKNRDALNDCLNDLHENRKILSLNENKLNNINQSLNGSNDYMAVYKELIKYNHFNNYHNYLSLLVSVYSVKELKLENCDQFKSNYTKLINEEVNAVNLVYNGDYRSSANAIGISNDTTNISNTNINLCKQIKSIKNLKLTEFKNFLIDDLLKTLPNYPLKTSINDIDFTEFYKKYNSLNDLQKFIEEVDNEVIEVPFIIQALFKPLILRFKFNFDSNKTTNNLSKPQLYFNYFISLLEVNFTFFSKIINPLNKSINSFEIFIDLILNLLTQKLNKSFSIIQSKPQLISIHMKEILKFDQQLIKFYEKVDNLLSIKVINNSNYFKIWLKFELDHYKTLIAKIFNENDLNNAINLILSLIKSITDIYKPLPLLSQRADFLLTVQLPLLELLGNHLTNKLSSFDSFSNSFYSLLTSVPGSFNQNQQQLQLPHQSLLTLIDISKNSLMISNKLLNWGDDLFFLQLWSQLSNQNFNQNIFTEFSNMFNDLCKKSDDLIVSFATSIITSNLINYLNLPWNTTSVNDLELSFQLLTKSLNSYKYFITTINDHFNDNNENNTVIVKRLINNISTNVSDFIQQHLISNHLSYNFESSNILLNDMISFCNLKTPHFIITAKSFANLLISLTILSLPSTSLFDTLPERTFSKAMQYAWDSNESFNKWLTNNEFSNLNLIGVSLTVNDIQLTNLDSQRLLKLRQECWR